MAKKLSTFNEVFSRLHPKGLRMVYARLYIQAYLTDRSVRGLAGHDIDSLTNAANDWVQHYGGMFNLSRADVEEAAHQILAEEKIPSEDQTL